ncbi:MAG: hypothetical protein FH753_02540 [Firmicutes bacterium]|nr:hypothetical protein [Bacillota bacterium]
MILIIISILCGYVGLYIGGLFGVDFLAISLGLIGFLSPGLYKLDQIHERMKSTESEIDILKLHLKETRAVINKIDKKIK